jgi:hypothetical protein
MRNTPTSVPPFVCVCVPVQCTIPNTNYSGVLALPPSSLSPATTGRVLHSQPTAAVTPLGRRVTCGFDGLACLDAVSWLALALPLGVAPRPRGDAHLSPRRPLPAAGRRGTGTARRTARGADRAAGGGPRRSNMPPVLLRRIIAGEGEG